ncbi:hypothetical protein BKA69DRAFT_1124503 [Paraphysoderma sedebokerense]|nr:hypothetical protein BKA69DRAFT_1124503 [Paraphysoderma sedebokerense]
MKVLLVLVTLAVHFIGLTNPQQPPATAWQYLESNSNYSTFVSHLTNASSVLISYLNNTNATLTLFATTNTGYERLQQTRGLLYSIIQQPIFGNLLLQYQVIPNIRFTYESLAPNTNQSLPSALSNLTVLAWKTNNGTARATNAFVTAVDQPVGNGVVQEVDMRTFGLLLFSRKEIGMDQVMKFRIISNPSPTLVLDPIIALGYGPNGPDGGFPGQGPPADRPRTGPGFGPPGGQG